MGRLKWFATGMVAGIGVYYGYKKVSENMDLIINFSIDNDEELPCEDEHTDIPVRNTEPSGETPVEDIEVTETVVASYDDVTKALNKLRKRLGVSQDIPVVIFNKLDRLLISMFSSIIDYIDIQRKHLRIIFEENTEDGIYHELTELFRDYIQYYKLLGLGYNNFDVDPMGLLKTDVPSEIFESIRDYLKELPGFNEANPEASSNEASEKHGENISKFEILIR